MERGFFRSGKAVEGRRGGVAALHRTISPAKLDREGAPQGAANGRVTS